MSKFKVIETVFADVESLKKALTELGLGFEVSENIKENTIPLYGYGNDQRDEKCALHIDREIWNNVAGTGASNDVGFAYNSETGLYDAIISEYDSGHQGTKMFDKIKQEYAFNSVTTTAKKKGYTVRKVEREGGQITLQLAKI